MNWDDFRAAFNDAKRTIGAADKHVGDMAWMIAGRLRQSRVSYNVLCELKRELARYNMHTKSWSEE